LFGVAALSAALLGTAMPVSSDEANPLRPPDTSSRRATMQGFIQTTDDIYRSMTGVMQNYTMSLTTEERR
jgi:hypothetical protein